MRLGTALKIIVLVAATLVVGAIALFKSIDVNRYRAFAADQVQRATGRQLEIRGRFDLDWSLTPALVAEDVVFANIAGGSRPEMMKVRRVEAEIGLLPLLTGTVEIRRLVLVEPDLLLETDATGRANWPFGEGVDDLAGGASDTARTALRIGKVRLNKAQIVWRDRRDGRLVVARLDESWSPTVRHPPLRSPLPRRERWMAMRWTCPAWSAPWPRFSIRPSRSRSSSKPARKASSPWSTGASPGWPSSTDST